MSKLKKRQNHSLHTSVRWIFCLFRSRLGLRWIVRMHLCTFATIYYEMFSLPKNQNIILENFPVFLHGEIFKKNPNRNQVEFFWSFVMFVAQRHLIQLLPVSWSVFLMDQWSKKSFCAKNFPKWRQNISFGWADNLSQNL